MLFNRAPHPNQVQFYWIIGNNYLWIKNTHRITQYPRSLSKWIHNFLFIETSYDHLVSHRLKASYTNFLLLSVSFESLNWMNCNATFDWLWHSGGDSFVTFPIRLFVPIYQTSLLTVFFSSLSFTELCPPYCPDVFLIFACKITKKINNIYNRFKLL